jgi:hypothetical protein
MCPDEPPPVPPLRNVPLPLTPIEPPPRGPASYGVPLPCMDESHWRFVFQDDPEEEEEARDDAQPDESSSD